MWSAIYCLAVRHRKKTENEKYVVTGMTCSACVGHVEKDVNRLEGLDKASVNLLTNSMQVEYDEVKLNEES